MKYTFLSDVRACFEVTVPYVTKKREKSEKENHRCLKIMGSLWLATNIWKLPKGKFPVFIKMPMNIFYFPAYDTACKTLQPSRMPSMQIEFSIPAVGYFLLLFRVIYLLCQILFSQCFGSACSLVYYDYGFLMLEKTEMNERVKTV